MLQLSPLPAIPYVEQLSIGAGQRALAISLAIAITAILLFLLFSFGVEKPLSMQEADISVVSISASEMSEDAPEPSRADQESPAETPVAPQPAPAEPLPPQAVTPPAAPTIAPPIELPPLPTPPKIGVRAPGRAVYGPPNSGGSASSRDSVRVGTAPNGEPLYAAAWYREPRPDELRGYLSAADGPGWGLIACRTVPDYRVEDCVGLDEYPTGSKITRAVLAAAWEFRVRPPRLGGQSMVGSWVRIRIDYGIDRQ